MNYLSAKFTLSEQGASVPLFTEGILAPITVAPTSSVWHSNKCCEISILRAVL